MPKHVGEYDLDRDVSEAVNEAIEHQDWCHWDCPGHRTCGCGADFTDAALELRRKLYATAQKEG